MNILTDVLPTQVLIDGQLYDLNTDFKTAIRIIQDFEDEELTVYEKNYLMIGGFILSSPKIPDEAVRLALRFLDGGGNTGRRRENAPLRLYSFSKDANRIYAAFRQTHGIDLQSAKTALVAVSGAIYGLGRGNDLYRPCVFAEAS